MVRAIRTANTQGQTIYAKAGAIAEQAIAGIRTVYAFSLQDRFKKKFDDKLSEAFGADVTKATALGQGVGFFFFVLFCIYGLAFWFGSTLVIKGEMIGANVQVVFFAMMLGKQNNFKDCLIRLLYLKR